jgi:hypothetical protein
MTGMGGSIRTANLIGAVVPSRVQMATTLGFHIILACLGIALPTIVLLAESRPVTPRRHGHVPCTALRHRTGACDRKTRVFHGCEPVA